MCADYTMNRYEDDYVKEVYFMMMGEEGIDYQKVPLSVSSLFLQPVPCLIVPWLAPLWTVDRRTRLLLFRWHRISARSSRVSS